MEILNLSGYTQEEKIAIAHKYLVPKQLEENGISSDHISFLDEGLKTLIRNFTAEAGLRNLERQIGALCRKVAMKIAKGEKSRTVMDSSTICKLLGPQIYTDEDRKITDEILCTKLPNFCPINS